MRSNSRPNEFAARFVGQAETDGYRLAGADRQLVERGGLGARSVWVHCIPGAVNHVVVDAVLGELRAVVIPVEPPGIGLVLGEQKLRRSLADQPALPVLRLVELDRVLGGGAQLGPANVLAPRPGVAEPDGRQQVQLSGLRPAIRHGDLDQNVVARGLRIFDEHIEVAILVEDAGVDQFELARVAASVPILLDQLLIREGGLRILVQILHVGVRRRGVQVEVAFLAVLAVIAFVAGEAEEPLFQDRIASVPQRDREADLLMTVRNARDPVFVPAVGFRAGVIVRDVFPGSAVLAIVLADSSPGALAEIGSPALPMRLAVAGFFESLMFGGKVIHHGL